MRGFERSYTHLREWVWAARPVAACQGRFGGEGKANTVEPRGWIAPVSDTDDYSLIRVRPYMRKTLFALAEKKEKYGTQHPLDHLLREK